MRVLWVKMGGFWPPTTGGRLRSLRIVSELARRHDVTVVTTHGSGDDADGLARALAHCREIVSIPFAVPKRGSAAFPVALARSWFSRYPVDLWKWRVAEVRRRVDALVDAGRADVCVADFLFAAANVPLGRVPTVLFEHNVEYLIWQRLAAVDARPWRRALLAVEWRKLRAREREACRAATLTITVSEADRRRLLELAPGIRAVSVPTGVDVDYFTPDHRLERADAIVFSGSMDWHPNEDAVVHFADAILPRVRARVPGTTFVIVGRNPGPRVRALAGRPGIVVTGTVEDVRPWVGQATVYVVPLRAGSGTRLKIFEALAMGKAVVSTTVGAEGLALEPDEHFVQVDDPAAFADAVVALMHDPARRRALGDAGRRLVETHYAWPMVAAHFERLCGEIAASPPERASAGCAAPAGWLPLSSWRAPRV